MALNQITVNVILSDDDRAVLLSLLTSVQGLTETIKAAYPAAEQHPVENPFPVSPAAAEQEAAEEPAQKKPKKEPEPEPVKTYTLENLQTRVSELIAKGGDAKAKAREILKKYATKVSAIPPERYAEFMAELEAL